jgi:hypothetical protein
LLLVFSMWHGKWMSPSPPLGRKQEYRLPQHLTEVRPS